MHDDPIFDILNRQVKGTEPDDFMLQCRQSLVSLVAQMPPDQAKYILEFVSSPCPYATDEEHNNWINSVHYKAMQLEVQHKLDKHNSQKNY